MRMGRQHNRWPRSQSGTFLNGKKIEGKVKVNAGDTLSFGNYPVFSVLRSAFTHA